MENLKSCPFCGGKAEIKYLKKYLGVISKVECTGCGARTRRFIQGDTVDSLWNRREERANDES